ncbi:MAG: transporter, family, hexuronate transporter [Thermoproteota archaeon]|nr:transporter, family, hexuronate transporter [Thermoproteota archaeon]
MSFAISWIVRTAYSPLIPEISGVLHLTNTEAGLLMTAFWAGYIIMQFPSGIISDRIGVRRTLTISLVLVGIFTITTGSASSFVEFLFYRFLCGLAAGCIFAPGAALILRWFKPKSRGTGISLFTTGSRIGALIGLIFAPVISTLLGSWRWSFWILSIPAFFMAIIVFIFMKESPEKSSGATRKPVRVNRAMSYSIIFKNKFFFVLLIAGVAYFSAYNVITTWAATYFIRVFSISSSYAGLIVSLFMTSGIVGMLLGGTIADRLKRGGPVVFIGYVTMSVTCTMIPTFVSFGIWFTVSTLMVLSLFGSMGGGLATSIMSHWFPLEISGTAAGFLNLATLGGCVSPSIFGAILDATGSFAMGWTILGATSIVLSMMMIPLIRSGQ